MGGLDPGDESCEPNEAIFRGLSLILCCRVTPQPDLCDLRKARYYSFYLLECVLSRAKVSSVLFTVNSQVCKKQSKTIMLRYVNVNGGVHQLWSVFLRMFGENKRECGVTRKPQE